VPLRTEGSSLDSSAHSRGRTVEIGIPKEQAARVDALELSHFDEYLDVVEVRYIGTLPFLEIKFQSFPSNQ
jgi:hypothetical protein